MSDNVKNFPVVGIGGSAGALEPFCKFLEHLPENSGAAVVIVNHVRRFATLLHKILPKYSKMPVTLISEKLEIKPNNVYIIPENRELYIDNGEFRLREISKTTGWPNIITLFMLSMAKNWRGKIIAGIVSGLDHDGVEALHKIKEEGGITFAQKPETAEHSDMPESAIKSGYVDYVLTPGEMAKVIMKISGTN